jgi:Tfp pilus assembly protein PilP
MRRIVLVSSAAVLLLSGCGRSPAPAPKTTPAPGTPVAAVKPGGPTGAELPKVEVPPAPGARWDAKGRRDPFEPPAAREGSASTVSAARLTGIVRSAGGAVLALVETADGLGYILKPGDTLGDGRVVEIGQNNVVFTVGGRPGSTTNRVVLKLAGD